MLVFKSNLTSVFIITDSRLYIVLLRVSFMSVVLRRNNKR